MPKDFTSNTFSEVYRDDYSDSAGFHKILFNSGRPLQARELTQLQTILQEQIRRFADNIFLEGAAVSSESGGAGVAGMDYVILESTGSTPAKSYEGVTLQGPAGPKTSGLQFLVVHAEEEDNEDKATLYGKYVSYNQDVVSEDVQETTLTFEEGDVLSDIRVLSGLDGLPTVTVRTQPGSSTLESTGRGLLFGVQPSHFWVQGHFVFAPKQRIVVSKYDVRASVEVGFHVIQDIVTVDDDESLYDNQGAVPNISSPGADRYRIRLQLAVRDSNDVESFVFFAAIRDGNVVYVKGASEGYNQIERRMAVRHFDTNGNFIVNPFDIRFKDADSDKAIELIVPGNVNGAHPTAFLDGYRLERKFAAEFKVKKPITYTEEEGTSLAVAYKNYVNVPFDSANDMGNWTSNFNVDTQTRMSLLNGSDVIGGARVRHIMNTLDDSEGYRLYLYDVKMEQGENFRNVTSMKPVGSADTPVDFALSSGQLYAESPEINNSLFEIPGGRVKSIHNMTFTVQRQFTATASGNSLSITTQSNENFTDKSRWVFINTSTQAEEIVSPVNISLNSSSPQTATCTVAGNGNYIIYAYVQKNNHSEKSKTYSRVLDQSSTLVEDSDGSRFVFNHYDGISLLSARADSANGRDITDQVEFDGGQRDNFYGPIVLRPSGLPSTVTTVFADFEKFVWGGSGHYFSVNSYQLNDSFGYADIPTFTSKRDGEAYDLRNHLDFRSKLDPYADTMSAADRFETPRDGDTISYDVQWYNRRIDHVALAYDNETLAAKIEINGGIESVQPKPPESQKNQLVLFEVEYGGNTLNTRDLEVTRKKYKRYRMEDIDKLENRLSNLEETVSLSFLEQEAANLVELDADGNVRPKTGFFVDDFRKGMVFSASPIGPNWVEDDALYGQTLIFRDDDSKVIAPKRVIASTTLQYDSDNKFHARIGTEQKNVIRKGDLLMLDYMEVLDSSLSSTAITWYPEDDYEDYGYTNVNPFNVIRGEGFLKISPSSDFWTDTQHLPDKEVVKEETVNIENQYPSGSSCSNNNGALTGSSTETNIDKIEEDVYAYSIPFARQKEIFASVNGLRPKTRYWPFFDGVNVSQWIVSETEQEHQDHLKRNDHLKQIPEVDTSLLAHPRLVGPATSTLLTDEEGKLFFSFWLPNNSEISSPNGNSFSSVEEWEEWIDAQRKEAARYGDVDDPQVYDQIGWKFRSGSLDLSLFDTSSGDPRSSKTYAITQFTSSGTLNVTQNTVYTTRTTTNNYNPSNNGGSSGNPKDPGKDLWDSILPPKDPKKPSGGVTFKPSTPASEMPPKSGSPDWDDPVAQSFIVSTGSNSPGVFLTKVDIYARSAPKTANRGGTDLAIPLQLQIRELVGGVPSSASPGEQFRIYKSADEVYDTIQQITDLEDQDDILSHPVTFEFEEPVFLKSSSEYALVLLSDCDDYEVFISTANGLVIGTTDRRIQGQSHNGSFFVSQNGSTWTPRQDQNLAFRMHTAKFTQNEGHANLFNSKYPRYNHNSYRISVGENDLSRFRVNQKGHGLGVGDNVHVRGLDSGASYFGVSGADIMNSSLVIDSADVNGYYVPLASGSFSEAGWINELGVSTDQAFNFDRSVMNIASLNFNQTYIKYEGSFISGVSHSQISETATSDPRFDFSSRNLILQNRKKTYFTSPKYLANPNQEYSSISPANDSAPSIVIGATLTTNVQSTFGGPKAFTAAQAGYISDVSPVIDLQRCSLSLENFLIDNQPVDSSGGSSISNLPHVYRPETHPAFGTSPSKHITKPILLEQAANGVRVYVDIYKPPAADFEVYYRTIADADENIFNQSWIRIESENEPSSNIFSPETFDINKLKFSQYDYLIGGEDGNLPDFTSFQLKVVMKTTNTCEIPIIKSIRAIALI